MGLSIFNKSLLIFIICLLLASCALKYERPECRHTAVECALLWGEMVGNDNIGIAIGPSKNTVWHGQAHLKNPTRWLVNTGTACEIGKMEDFTPQIYMTLKQFLEFQFGWIK